MSETKGWMEEFMHGTGSWGLRKPDKPYFVAIGGVLCLCATDGAAFVAVPTDVVTDANPKEVDHVTPPCGLISRHAEKRTVRLDVLRKWARSPESVLVAFSENGDGPYHVKPDREGEIGGVRIDRNRLAHVLQGFAGETVTVWTHGHLEAVMIANESAVAILMPRTAVVFEEQEQIAEALDRQRVHEGGMAS